MDAISVESNLNRADTVSITGVRHHHGQENLIIGDQNHRLHRLYEPLGWRYLLAEHLLTRNLPNNAGYRPRGREGGCLASGVSWPGRPLLLDVGRETGPAQTAAHK